MFLARVRVYNVQQLYDLYYQTDQAKRYQAVFELHPRYVLRDHPRQLFVQTTFADTRRQTKLLYLLGLGAKLNIVFDYCRDHYREDYFMRVFSTTVAVSLTLIFFLSQIKYMIQ